MTAQNRFTADTLVRCRKLGALDVSPDGRWLVVAMDELASDGKRYDTNLYRLDLEDPSSGLVALTRNTRKKARPRFAPDGTLGFLAQPDPGRRKEPAPAGSEAAKDAKDKKSDDEAPLQVHRLRLDGGEPEQLTDLPNGVKTFRWSKDMAHLVLLAPVHPSAKDLADNAAIEKADKERAAAGRTFDAFPLRFWDHFLGPRHPHVVVAAADGRNPRDLTPGLGVGLDESDFDISPDGRTIVFELSTHLANLEPDTQVWTLDIASGERKQLTKGPAVHWEPRWSPDGMLLSCLVQPAAPRVTGKADVATLDPQSGAVRILTAALDTWPATTRFVDAQRLVVSGDEAGHHRLRLINVKDGTTSLLTEEGHVAEACPTPDGQAVFALLDRIHHPADLIRVPTGGGEATRLTNVNAEHLEGIALTPGSSHVIEGADGHPVQLWEVRPPDFDAKKKYPLLLWIHGGPIGASMDQFHYRWNAQIYAALGYVVIEVNPRGSTGFGQDFIQGNNGDWGNRCYRDLMRSVDEWARKPYVDATRIAALGGSFGGYMVNWIAGHEDRFRCLVSHAGLYNLTAFHGTTDGGPWWEREFGVPWEDARFYDANSPHHHVAKFKTPTLVIHGELDYRVPLADGLQMFYALQRKGVPSKFLYFPDENHWILKPPNMQLWNETVISWLAQWMK